MSFVEKLFNPETAREKDRVRRREEREDRKNAFQEQLERLSPEQREDIEAVMRRGKQIMRHLKNLEAYNSSIVAEHADAFFSPLSREEKYSEYFDSGVRQSLRILIGGVATAGSLVLPSTPIEYGIAGFASLLGAGVAWFSALEWRQHISPVSRKKARDRVQKKTGDRMLFADGEGFVSEQNLRIAMLDSDDMIAKQRVGLRGALIAFQERVIKESDPLEIAIERTNLVGAYNTILKTVVDQQERLLVASPEYEELSRFLREDRLSQTLGLATATSLLVAGRGVMPPLQGIEAIVEKGRGYVTVLTEQASLRAGAAAVGTLLSILGGSYLRLTRDIPKDESVKRSMKSALTLAGQELVKLKKKKAENFAYLRRLNPEYREGDEATEAAPPIASLPSAGVDPDRFNEYLDKVHDAIYDITSGWDFPPFKENIPEEPTPKETRSEPIRSQPELVPQSTDVIKLAPRTEIPIELTRSYAPSPIEAPSQEALLAEISKQTIKNRLIGDHLRLIRGDKKYVPTKEELDQPIEEVLIALARDESTSRDVIESILFYDDILIKNLRTISPKETVVSFFRIDDFIQKLKEARQVLEKVLREKEQQEAQILVRTPLSPGAFRAFIPGRYGMGFFIPGEEISLDALKQTLDAWQRSKDIGKISKNSLVRFLRVCYSVLAQMIAQTSNVDERKILQEKRRDIRCALKIVDIIRERNLSDPLLDEQGFANDLRNLSDEYMDDQDEYPELRDTKTLGQGIESLGRDPDFIHPNILGKNDSSINEVSVMRFSDSPSRPDPENQMVLLDYPVSVSAELIIGSFTARDSWIGVDRDYIAQGAAELMNHPAPAVFKNWFFDSSTKKPHVQLVKIAYHPPAEDTDRDTEQGEEYPVYLVKTGHEYVAMAKLAGTPVIAEVMYQRIPSKHYPLYVEVLNEYIARASELQGLENRELIAGVVPKKFLDSPSHRAKIEAMAIPGLLLFSPNGTMFFKLYEKLNKIWSTHIKKIKNVKGEDIDPFLLTSRLAYRKMAS